MKRRFKRKKKALNKFGKASKNGIKIDKKKVKINTVKAIFLHFYLFAFFLYLYANILCFLLYFYNSFIYIYILFYFITGHKIFIHFNKVDGNKFNKLSTSNDYFKKETFNIGFSYYY